MLFLIGQPAQYITARQDGQNVYGRIAGEDAYAHNAVLRLANLHTLEVTAQIDELDVGAVTVGQPASIRLDAFPGHTIKGTLQRLAPAATPQRGSTTYEAVVSLEPGTWRCVLTWPPI